MRRHWSKLAALAFVVGVLGLPINDLFRYLLLLIAALAVCAGSVSAAPRRMAAALGVAILAIACQWIAAPPRIEEGYNVFVAEAAKPGALEAGLPRDVFQTMLAEFDRAYPAAQRCKPNTAGCWRDFPPATRTYAFSADAIYDSPLYSRRVTHIEFTDPQFWRADFVNDLIYNWYGWV